ncbi:hypothetical protein DFH07DRAFT_853064 [Mycena maculata]|uniref:Uncharacterized protein n=1 Tax=Mycena maculata TaxID=230809 RepID=A0AAD7HQX9_9AGAR|nr:hypothetical protein DFH07DRAFT_853064 [Mycena maculata]
MQSTDHSGTTYLVTPKQYAKMTKLIEDYKEELEEEEDPVLKAKTRAKLTKLLGDLRKSPLRARIQQYITGRSEEATFRDDVEDIWADYQRESDQLKQFASSAAPVQHPTPSASLPISTGKGKGGASSQYSIGSYKSKGSQNSLYNPRPANHIVPAAQNNSNPQFFQNQGVSNPPGIPQGVNVPDAPWPSFDPPPDVGSARIAQSLRTRRHHLGPSQLALQ